MAGKCIYCGFVGSNEAMEQHAGDCPVIHADYQPDEESMGACYYILKENPKVKFELGKGNWFLIIDSTNNKSIKQLYADENELVHAMLIDCSDRMSDDVTLGYFRELAKQIINWCGDDAVRILSDGAFEGYDYLETGTRFKDE